MDILFTGVTGRIGSKIADHLTDGHNLIGLARSIPKSGPATGTCLWT